MVLVAGAARAVVRRREEMAAKDFILTVGVLMD